MVFRVPEDYRITRVRAKLYNLPPDAATTADLGNYGAFYFPRRQGQPHRDLFCIASEGMGWEHISVHARKAVGAAATPSWDEMAFVKGQFWGPEDLVVQYHPPVSEYVNTHPHTLHLWRPLNAPVPLPPYYLVGARKGQERWEAEEEANRAWNDYERRYHR